MHRSGTSLVARIVNLLGVSLGDPAGMLAPQYDNPRGFWEQRAVMDLNDELLAALGGSVWSPPDLPAGWETRPDLAPLEDEARALIAREFTGAPRWGIKDPRLSLTLPFWLRVAPDPACVVCVRAPMDVVRSLLRREPHLHTLDSAAQAWTRYTAAALANTAGARRLLVFQQDVLADPHGETDRLAAFLGVDPAAIGDELRARVAEFLDPQLVHHASPDAEHAGSDALPLAARHLYLALRAARLAEERAPGLPEALAGTTTRILAELAELDGRLAHAHTTIAHADAKLADAERAAADAQRAAHQWRVRAQSAAAAAPPEPALGGVAGALSRRVRRRGSAAAPSPEPRVTGRIERPALGAPVPRDGFEVSGSATLEPGPAARGDVLLDGTAVAPLSLGDDARFAGEVPAAALPGDRASVQVAIRLEDVSGATATLALDGPVELAAQALGWLDLPPGSVRRDQFLVGGWALFTPGVTARVEVLVDGRAMGRARLGLPRPDVAADHPASPAAEVAGFELHVPASDLPGDAGAVGVTARAVAVDGRELELRTHVRLEPELEPLIDPDGRGEQLRTRFPTPGPGRPRHDRPRLLAAAHSLREGGAERYLYEQLLHLQREHGFDPTVVAPAPGPYLERFEAAGIDVHVDRMWPGNDLDAYEDAILDLCEWATPHEFDLAFVNTILPFIGGDLASRLGIPYAWALHESFDLSAWWTKAHGSDRGFGSAYVRSRAEEALRGAALTLFPSAPTRDLYAPYVDPDRMRIMPTGIDLEGLDTVRARRGDRSLRERLGWGPDVVMVLCLAMVAEPRKGQASLLQAFSAIREEHPDARLALVGDTPSEYSAALHRLADRSGLQDVVHFEPVTDAPYEWLLAADLLVLPSDVEALPMAVLEAMALGTPVLATSIFGVPDVIEEGRTGWMCPPNDVPALAAALSRILALSPAERAPVAARAQEVVERDYAAGRYAEALAPLLAGLITGERDS